MPQDSGENQLQFSLKPDKVRPDTRKIPSQEEEGRQGGKMAAFKL